MKLPWDRNWFKGCFYLVITFTLIYIIKLGIDMCAYTLINASGVVGSFFRIIKRIAAVFAPVLIALITAYILEPLVTFIKKRVKSRHIACLSVFSLIILPPVILIIILVLKLKHTGGGSIAKGISVSLSECIKRLDVVYMQAMELLDRAGLSGILRPYIEKLLNKNDGFFHLEGNMLKLLVTCILNLLLGMVMAFYLLMGNRPLGRLGEILSVLLPNGIYNRCKIIAEDFDAVLSGYIRGQLTDGLIMAVLISAGLWLVKIPFAPVIGIISGFSNIVPYFGSMAGFLLTGIAAVISGDNIRILYGLGVMFILQQIDSAIIVPKIVGTRVEISPFGVIAALTVGSKLFGVWGMMLAVPAVAVGKVFVMRAYERKRNNRL